MLNNIYLANTLSESQKEGIIKLLYKKGNEKELKNWRPISLLNIDYKILTKILANRVKEVLPKIIDQDQACGIKGRSIHDHLETLTGLFEITNDKAMTRPGMAFLAVDQEKAFDRLEHNYLFQTLSALGFGQKFIRWAKILYRNIHSKVEIQGALTDKIDIQRSVRQGCPISMIFFIIAQEGLGELIRENINIKGYKLPTGKTIKILSYADDNTFIITDMSSVDHIMEEIKTYCQASGAKLNKDKTECLKLGKWENTNFKEVLSWIKPDIKILGQIFSNKEMAKKNYGKIIDRIDSCIKHWRSLRIACLGKVILVNTVAMAPLWHIAGQVQLHKNQIKRIENSIYNYIWGSDIEPIKRTTNQQPRKNGGMGVQNIKKKQEAIWIKHMLKVIEEPNSPKSILTRMRLAPSIKWDNLMRDRGATKTARINNWIKTLDLDHLNTNQELKHIYNNSIDLIEWDQDRSKEIQNLNKIKQPELWIVGYQTLHQGHKTLSWFKNHNFNKIGDIPIDGNCTTCHVSQTQEHIFNDCKTTENLRKHINNNRNNWTNIDENKQVTKS